MSLVVIPQPSFLGTGFAFPLQLDSSGTRPKILSDEDLVKQDMISLILTKVGERPFLVKNGVPFGTRISTALFENSDVATDIIVYETNRALTVWEPRIVVTETTVNKVLLKQGGVSLNAVTTFVFRATSRSDNLVVPYTVTSPV